MTAPTKPTIDKCIADSEADVMLFAQIPEAEKQLAIAAANLEFLRNYKRITEAAGRPEPAREFTCGLCGTAPSVEKADYDRLLDYADRMAAERDEAVNVLKAEGIRPKGKSCLPYIIRAETAERQLAEAEKREKSKHEQYTALLERHTKQTERLAELQAKHDALVNDSRIMARAIQAVQPIVSNQRAHFVRVENYRAGLKVADTLMSAVAIKGGE